jgi:hypothetical protein
MKALPGNGIKSAKKSFAKKRGTPTNSIKQEE